MCVALFKPQCWGVGHRPERHVSLSLHSSTLTIKKNPKRYARLPSHCLPVSIQHTYWHASSLKGREKDQVKEWTVKTPSVDSLNVLKHVRTGGI